jgi:hypothetical protein
MNSLEMIAWLVVGFALGASGNWRRLMWWKNRKGCVGEE